MKIKDHDWVAKADKMVKWLKVMSSRVKTSLLRHLPWISGAGSQCSPLCQMNPRLISEWCHDAKNTSVVLRFAA